LLLRDKRPAAIPLGRAGLRRAQRRVRPGTRTGFRCISRSAERAGPVHHSRNVWLGRLARLGHLPQFHATADWVRLLKNVVRLIGTTMSSGVCEIFPPDSLPSRFGKGMRAPGCWNPRTDTCSEIVWENTRSSLGSVLSRNRKTAPLISNALEGQFPDIERSISFSSPLYRSGTSFSASGSRHPRPATGSSPRLWGDVPPGWARNRTGAGTGAVRRKTVTTKATEAEHLASFEALWMD